MVCPSEDKNSVVLLLTLVLTSYAALVSASRGKIGIAYGLNGDNLLSPQQAVKLLSSRGIKRVRTYDARPGVVQAFANSRIDLTISVPNEEVPRVAANVGEAFNWVSKHVLPFPTCRISAILVGNEWLLNPSNDPSLLVPAMQNIYNALSTVQNLSTGIKVSTSHSFAVLSKSFPPSRATFAEEVVAVMRPLLAFLKNTNSFFMVNIFPYFAYLEDKGVSLEFALFESTEAVTDPNTGLKYTNLFDLQLDAIYAAIMSLSSSMTPSKSSACACNSTDSPYSTSPCACNSGEVEWKTSNEPSLPPRTTAVEAANRKSGKRTAGKQKKPRIPVRTGEIGWSSGGGSADTPPRGGRRHTEIFSDAEDFFWGQFVEKAEADVKLARCPCDAATLENARTFNQNLIRHVLRNRGTPAHPKTRIRAYIFELFNEDLKPAGPEQHFGVFYPNGTAVYPINFNDRGK